MNRACVIYPLRSRPRHSGYCWDIRLYQKFVSPSLAPNTCRFYPSCSHYGYQAIYRHGVLRGLPLTIWRILRCNPSIRVVMIRSRADRSRALGSTILMKEPDSSTHAKQLMKTKKLYSLL